MNPIRILLRQIKKAVMRPVYTLKALKDVVVLSIRRLRRESENRLRATELDFDSQYGTDTGSSIRLSNLDIIDKSWIYGIKYQPTYAELDFHLLLDGLIADYNEFTFIDLGSGKGRVLLIASSLPFKQIIGVEFSYEFNDIAQSNIDLYPEELKQCKNIRTICMDASLYTLPVTPMIIYLYNPFEPPILTRVIDNIDISYDTHPRRIIVIVMNQVYAKEWAACKCLRKVAENGGCHIYDTYGELRD